MRQYNPYTEANMMGAWFESQANRLPAVLTDVELDKLAGEAQAQLEAARQNGESALEARDILALVAEIRSLRSRANELTSELSADLGLDRILR